MTSLTAQTQRRRERETLTVCGATSPWYKKGLDELWFMQGSDLMMNRLFVFVKVPKEQFVVFRVFKLNIQHQNILTGILQQYTVGNSKIEKWEKTHLRFLSTPTAVCRSIKKTAVKLVYILCLLLKLNYKNKYSRLTPSDLSYYCDIYMEYMNINICLPLYCSLRGCIECIIYSN